MGWRKTLAAVVFVTFGCAPAWATMQIPDRIVIDGSPQRDLLPYEFLKTPLWPAFESDREVGKRAHELFFSRGHCTALHRGYRASWEIKDGVLYLTAVEKDGCSNGTTVPLTALFPDSSGPVAATWFTGNLTVPVGVPTPGGPGLGLQAVYDSYEIIHVGRGRVAALPEYTPEQRKGLLKFFWERRMALLADKVRAEDVRGAVCRTVAEAERLEREGKYLASIDKLYELERFGAIHEFPSRDTQMLLSWLYTRLQDKRRISFFEFNAYALRVLASDPRAQATNDYFEIHTPPDFATARACD